MIVFKVFSQLLLFLFFSFLNLPSIYSAFNQFFLWPPFPCAIFRFLFLEGGFNLSHHRFQWWVFVLTLSLSWITIAVFPRPNYNAGRILQVPCDLWNRGRRLTCDGVWNHLHAAPISDSRNHRKASWRPGNRARIAPMLSRDHRVLFAGAWYRPTPDCHQCCDTGRDLQHRHKVR